jgi:hypothetical protein
MINKPDRRSKMSVKVVSSVKKFEKSPKGFLVVQPKYREKGVLSFGRWYKLLVDTAAKRKVKLPLGKAQDAYVKAYKAGKNPRDVLGLVQ